MDMAILMGIQSAIGSPVLDTVMPVITNLGEKGAIWLLITLFLFIFKSTRRWGFVMLAAMVIDYVCVEAIKHVVARPRPFMDNTAIQILIPAPDGSSFPSGHTSFSFAAATILLFTPIKKYWKVLAVILAVIIAFSRLYLCVHYPTDVLGGMLIGIAVSLLVVWVNKQLIARGSDKKAQRGKHARTAA